MADGKVIIDTMLNHNGFIRGVTGLKKNLGGLKSILGQLTGAVGLAFGVGALVLFSKKAIELGSSVSEVQNVVDTAFGDMSYKMEAFAETSIQNFGMSRLAAKQMASTYMAMSRGMGQEMGIASDKAIEMTGRLGDVASFYNKTQEEVDTIGKAVYSGETEPLKQIGIIMTQNNLELFAMQQGYQQLYKDMSAANQLLVRQEFFLNASNLAAGDFLKTQDSWANQTRILSMQWQEFMSIIGQALILVLAPLIKVLNRIVSALISMANLFHSTISGLFGGANTQIKQTQSSAEQVGSAVGDSVDNQDALTNAVKNTNKEQKKSLAGFDALTVLTEGAAEAASGGASSGMGSGSDVGSYEAITIPDTAGAEQAISFFERLNVSIQPTMDALSQLWDQLCVVASFAWDGLKDFYDHFLVPIGAWALGENGLPRFIGLVCDTLANINWGGILDSLSGLWTQLSNFSTFVGDALIDFFEYFMKPLAEWRMNEAVPRFVDALTNGLAAVDWNRIREVLIGLWTALEPFAETVGEGLLWLWENVLVPFGTWVTNDVIPLFLVGIAVALKLVQAVFEVVQPGLEWFWINFLEPIAVWTGGVIVSVLEDLVTGLQEFGAWVSEHKGPLQDIILVIGSFYAAWQVVNLALIIQGVVGALVAFIATGGIATIVLNALNVAIGILTSPITLVVAAIGVLIAIVVLCIKHWEDIKVVAAACWEKIKETWHAVAEWFNSKVVEPVVGFFSGLWTSVADYFKRLWSSIKGIWNGVSTWFNTTVVEPVGKFFSGLWENIATWASNAWDGIVAVFKGISDWFTKHIIAPISDGFRGFINGLIGFVEGFVNAFIRGLNKIIGGFNRLSIKIPDNPIVGAVNLGFNIPSISELSIPRLAKGAVIPPNREFMAVLGDQKGGTNIETPERLLRQLFREESGATAIIQELREILAALREGKIMLVDGKVLGELAQGQLAMAARSRGGVPIPVR